MSQTAVSQRYIEALVGAAEERGVLDQVEEEAGAILDLIEESTDLSDFLTNPMLPSAHKEAFVRTLLAGKVSDVMLNFLLVICSRQRERVLKEILEDFQTFMDTQRGIVTAQVSSAVPLSSEQQTQLVARLSAYSGKQVRLETEVDENLKAGFIARLGDQVFDGTLETQLSRLRQRLAG